MIANTLICGRLSDLLTRAAEPAYQACMIGSCLVLLLQFALEFCYLSLKVGDSLLQTGILPTLLIKRSQQFPAACDHTVCFPHSLLAFIYGLVEIGAERPGDELCQRSTQTLSVFWSVGRNPLDIHL